MLVLNRREGESIVIDGDVVVTVLEIRSGGIVRLGIAAPREIPVHRAEVQRQIEAEGARRPTA
jgi:carbon storage regulator